MHATAILPSPENMGPLSTEGEKERSRSFTTLLPPPLLLLLLLLLPSFLLLPLGSSSPPFLSVRERERMGGREMGGMGWRSWWSLTFSRWLSELEERPQGAWEQR